MPAPSLLQRQRYRDPLATTDQAAHAECVLSLLLAQNGSTTLLCETLAGGPVTVQLLKQSMSEEVPEVVKRELPGTRFMERITSLTAHGQVLTDNLVYVALEGLARPLQQALEQGEAPIGHLLAHAFSHRHFLTDTQALQNRLWHTVGLPDAAASRAYRLVTAEGLHMLIVETFRRGLLAGASARQSLELIAAAPSDCPESAG
jgi:chorismate-pyruvate lyase